MGLSRGVAATAEVPDDRVLLAVERAARHDTSISRRRPRAALWQNVILHLRLKIEGGSGTRRIREPMRRLEEAGLIVGGSDKGTRYWTVSKAGSERIGELRKAGRAILPESPQHQDWREARDFAEQELPYLLDDLLQALAGAVVLYFRNVPAHSDECFEVSARLHLHSWQVASAVHILHEWPEPAEDGGTDRDFFKEPGDVLLGSWERAARQVRREGRRDTWRWYGDLLPRNQHWIPSRRNPPLERPHYE